MLSAFCAFRVDLLNQPAKTFIDFRSADGNFFRRTPDFVRITVHLTGQNRKLGAKLIMNALNLFDAAGNKGCRVFGGFFHLFNGSDKFTRTVVHAADKSFGSFVGTGFGLLNDLADPVGTVAHTGNYRFRSGARFVF